MERAILLIALNNLFKTERNVIIMYGVSYKGLVYIDGEYYGTCDISSSHYYDSIDLQNSFLIQCLKELPMISKGNIYLVTILQAVAKVDEQAINKDNIFSSYTPLNKYIVTSGVITDFKYIDENKVIVTLASMQISSSPIEKPKFLKN